MSIVVSEIVDGEHPAFPEVLLDAGRPLVDRGGLDVARHDEPEGVLGKDRAGIGREDTGEGLSAGVVCPGLSEGNRTVEVNLVDEGRIGGCALGRVQSRRVVHDGGSRAEYGTALAGGVEGERRRVGTGWRSGYR